MFNVVKNKSKLLVATACAATLAMALFGCSSGAGSSAASSSVSESLASSAVSDSSSASEGAGLSFGRKTETSLSIKFTNETGRVITGLKAADVSAPEVEVVLMGASDSLPVGEQAEFFVESVEGGRFLLTFECDGAQYQLHDVDFAILDEAIILVQDDVAYLNVLVDGNAISTLQEEYDAVHPSAAEEQVPAYDNSASYSNEPVPAYDGGPSETYYDEPAEAPAQSEDACVDDPILN